MSEDHDERVAALFDELAPLAKDEQRKRLRSADIDQEIRAEVEDLLEYADRDDAFADGNVGGVLRDLVLDRSEDDPSGSRASEASAAVDAGVLAGLAGRYRVIREIGRGGMGVVYEAEQLSPRRRVALKVLRAQLSGPEARLRFQREAELLGKLLHPGIAHIYEAVLDPKDANEPPFIAMEYVEGERLDRHADRRELDLRERVELVARVCDAVQHAHGRGVLHRDLKPGNILVTDEEWKEDDGLDSAMRSDRDRRASKASGTSTRTGTTARRRVGVPRVLDFGVARAVDAETQTMSLQTEVGQIIGTLAYMSPEQVSGDPSQLDTRCDVYALGVILYQLLTGRLPFDLSQQWIAAAARIIREEDPPPPSSIDGRLRGDLATIIERAMAKEPAMRYHSAAELAADLRRFLSNEPIVARPASAAYHIRKLVARHRAVAGMTLVLVLVVLAGSIWGFFERQDAIARAAAMGRLSDMRRLRLLTQSFDELWPATPEHLAPMAAWLDEAGDLLARIPDHEARLAKLRVQATPVPDPDQVDAVVYDFAGDDENAWWHDTLAELLAGLHDLEQHDRFAPTVAAMQHRREMAATIDERSLSSTAAREAWQSAREAIAANAAYGGLDLPPQLGLLPLGADPDSGLHEFAHLQSGEPARRDPSTGRLEVGDRTGIVLVLLPGGTFVMGSGTDPDGPNYDPDALPASSPLTEATLRPFFMSKFETTVAQWETMFGVRPDGAQFAGDGFQDLHPVNQVSWLDSTEAARRWDLDVPTEARWEYACRAGTQTPWSSGADKGALRRHANLADRSYGQSLRSQENVERWSDGYPMFAEVGQFRPNAFGLCDMHGNVMEWCRDRHTRRLVPVSSEAGDGTRVADPPDATTMRVVRGGSWYTPALYSRSGMRTPKPVDYTEILLGVRFSRDVDTAP